MPMPMLSVNSPNEVFINALRWWNYNGTYAELGHWLSELSTPILVRLIETESSVFDDQYPTFSLTVEGMMRGNMRM